MIIKDPNEVNLSGPDSPMERHEHTHGDDGQTRPYGDAGNLYDIPPVRPEDPPMRDWWIDDEASAGQPSNH